jgi:putative ATP-dependent endonuclease of the OLD family
MLIESLSLTNFRCFGPETQRIDLSSDLTAFIGTNGSGKTAVLNALLRLFGVTSEQRRMRRQDFHVPASETMTPNQRELVIEVILAFPELDSEDGDDTAVPEFFHQMATDDNGRLKCRLRMQATWTDDGSLEGAVEQKFWAIRTLGGFEQKDCVELKQIDRARIQMLYVPAARDAASQVGAFLRSRLWRAIMWSQQVRDAFEEAGKNLNDTFIVETAVDIISKSLEKRWLEVHSAGTDAKPLFRPIDPRFQEFIRKVEVVFHPDEFGQDRSLDNLSDGQRSLFHLAMTATTLDVEDKIVRDEATGFQAENIHIPTLTLIAIEEPENSLAPFYLSRIVRQLEDLTRTQRAQAIVSSHSASIMGRVDPGQVRHFQLHASERTAVVKAIRLPENDEDAAKFVREAVRAYPELYFARFVILGEGASEEVVLPRLADALGLPIDRSFVAIVPLGGRHVNHLWRLLADLAIPHATLLDLDLGRSGGGWGRIKTACVQLLANGLNPASLFGNLLHASGPSHNLAAFDSFSLDQKSLKEWAVWLRNFGVYFCWPLDLDYTMLRAFSDAYRVLEPGRAGPGEKGDARNAVLGADGNPSIYDDTTLQDDFRWYRYLFLGRGKPSTHVRVLSTLDLATLKKNIPEEMHALLTNVIAALDAPADRKS